MRLYLIGFIFIIFPHQTSHGALPNRPVKVKYYEVSPTSLRLSWRSSDRDVIDSYIIRYKPRKDKSLQFKEIFNVRQLKWKVTGLTPYTLYQFYVVAVNTEGHSSASMPVEVRTGTSAPGSPPRNVNAFPDTSSSVWVSWNEPAVPNGIIKGYKVFYTLNKDDPIMLWRSMETGPNKQTKITNLKTNKTYTISVLAYSLAGQGPFSEKINVFTKAGVPAQPHNLKASSVTASEITLVWDAPSGRATVESYEIYYNDSLSRQSIHRSLRPAYTTYKIRDLAPDTLYGIQVSARSRLGEGAKTPVMNIKTKKYVSGAPPEAVSGQKRGSETIEVTWKPPPMGHYNGVITGYQITYIEKSQQSGSSMVIKVPANARSVLLTNLKKWTWYRIWVTASTDIGNGSPSKPVSVRTDEDIPGKPRKLDVEAINSTTAYIEWQPPLNGERNGVIKGYIVRYHKIDELNRTLGQQKSYHVDDGIDGTSAIISDLSPKTRYRFRVAAKTRKGDGLLSNIKIKTTLGAVPSAPQNVHLQFKQRDPPIVKVQWRPPLHTHGEIRAYKIVYGRIGEKYEEEVSTRKKYIFITGSLDRGAVYEFRISAHNGVGYGHRATETIRTPDGNPGGAPQNFTAVGLSETMVRLTWDPPERSLRNGKIILYQINYHRQSDSLFVDELNTTETSIELTGLEMLTDYVFQIKAFTSIGAGPWSNKLFFRTFGKRLPAPKNVQVQWSSERTLRVTWDELDQPVFGYRIFYTPFPGKELSLWPQLDLGPYSVIEISSNIQKEMTYAVKVQAFNGRYGNLSKTAYSKVKTSSDSFKKSVKHFRAVVKSNQVHLQWTPPEIKGVNNYLVRFSGVKRFMDYDGRMKTVSSSGSEYQIAGQQDRFIVPNLQPKMKYTFNISAVFKDASTGPIVSLIAETLITAPPTMEVPTLIRANQDTIRLRLTRASEKNGPLDYYLLIVIPENKISNREPDEFMLDDLTNDKMSTDIPANEPYIAARFESRRLPSIFELGNQQIYGSFHNRPLNPEFSYRVFIRVYSVENKFYTSSDYSEKLSLGEGRAGSWTSGSENDNFHYRENGYQTGEDGVERVRPTKTDGQNKRNILMIIVPVCGGIIILLIVGIIIVIYLRRKSKSQPQVITEAPSKAAPELPAYPIDPVDMHRQTYQTSAMISHPPIPMERFAEHVEMLKANDNFKFSQEYESIETGQQFTWENSNREENKSKNRYSNVVAYDHSRVVLHIDRDNDSDYINANYMDGYRKQRAYIATQGPMPECFKDFWRMVWEQRSASIIMMTRLEERNRVKCDQYWPNRGSETYGMVNVFLKEVVELATYTVRVFCLTHYGQSEKREIKQYQFTAWPDHGVPDYPTPLLMFVRRVKYGNPPDAGPIIVHCSAGVGRTGAYIVIESMLERIINEHTVDIYGHVTRLRSQRNYMVQTDDQYIFIHDAIVEAIQNGNTDILAKSLNYHLQRLLQSEGGDSLTGMELEFRKLASVKANHSKFVSANLPVNKFKNRLVNILPYESSRVPLQPIRGVDGSDYINASFIDGYRYRTAYIATQGPLTTTTEDFWRMLWEHNSTIIVMLSKLCEMGREICHQYWPTERSARYQYFVVDPINEYNMPQYIMREFKVTDARDGQSRTVRQFQFTEWPEQGVPKSGECFIDFLGQVHKTKDHFGQDGPIAVHCSAGVGRTGVFITLSIVLERMRYEGYVDMYNTLKILRTQRPCMVQTEDQYQFCYHAALEYLSSFDHYAN